MRSADAATAPEWWIVTAAPVSSTATSGTGPNAHVPMQQASYTGGEERDGKLRSQGDAERDGAEDERSRRRPLSGMRPPARRAARRRRHARTREPRRREKHDRRQPAEQERTVCATANR